MIHKGALSCKQTFRIPVPSHSRKRGHGKQPVDRFRWILSFGLGLLAWNWSGARALAADAPSPPLNIVLLVADDLGWGEVGCYGQKKIPTPHIDQLAREGMRFTQFYSGAPVCAPSRCVLMTGKHLGHAEVRSNLPASKVFPEFDEGQYPLSAEAVTFAQIFQKGGYATGAFGKWGLGPVESTGDPNRKGFDLFYGYNSQSVAHSYYPEHLWRNREKVTINSPGISGHQQKREGDIRAEDYQGQHYGPDLMVAEAEKFLANEHDRPFFLFMPFIEPHVALHPPLERLNQFPREWDPDVYRGEGGYLPHPRPHAAYAALISELDSYVGRIMDKLKEYNLADRTLVIFTSDNGTTHRSPKAAKFFVGGSDAEFFNSTAGLKGYKGSVYEGGIRIPFIARLPGRIAAGAVNDTPGYFADLFKTLCAAARLTPPSGLDGENLWPLLTGKEELNREHPMVWVFPEYKGQVAVRFKEWKALRRDLKTRKPGDWEVYNIPKDPGEEQNLSREHPEIIARAEAVLRQEMSPNSVFPLTIPGVNSAEK